MTKSHATHGKYQLRTFIAHRKPTFSENKDRIIEQQKRCRSLPKQFRCLCAGVPVCPCCSLNLIRTAKHQLQEPRKHNPQHNEAGTRLTTNQHQESATPKQNKANTAIEQSLQQKQDIHCKNGETHNPQLHKVGTKQQQHTHTHTHTHTQHTTTYYGVLQRTTTAYCDVLQRITTYFLVL